MMPQTPRSKVVIHNSSNLVVKNLGPLVVANPMLQNMEIRPIVDVHCPPDPRMKVSTGQIIHAMAANRLCSPAPLLHVAEWAHDSGAELLLGISAADLTDDKLGRALDALFEKRWEILADVALHVASTFSVDLSKVHYDPTSFHFTGEYDNQSPSASLVPELRPFKIEYGRHALPGSHTKEAQVGVDLANDPKGPLPFFYHTADGSANGHQAVAKNLQHLLKFLKPKKLMMVTDRGCFSTGYAFKIRDAKFHFISSVTREQEHKTIYDEKRPVMREASFLSIKEKKKRLSGKPEATWERYYIGEVPYTLRDGKQAMRLRMLFVFSTADQKVTRSERARHTARIQQELESIKASVDKGYIQECKQVEKRLTKVFGNKQAQNYFEYSVRELASEELRSVPAKGKGKRMPCLKFTYQYLPDRAEADEKYDGLSVLLTNLPQKAHATEAIFTEYKAQHHIETSHHQWKAPIRLRPLFLKKPSRLESLVFVQFLSLMAFYLLQRQYRQAKGDNCRTTGETILCRFATFPVGIQFTDDVAHVTLFPCKATQQQTLSLLGYENLDSQIRKHLSHSLNDPFPTSREDIYQI